MMSSLLWTAAFRDELTKSRVDTNAKLVHMALIFGLTVYESTRSAPLRVRDSREDRQKFMSREAQLGRILPRFQALLWMRIQPTCTHQPSLASW